MPKLPALLSAFRLAGGESRLCAVMSWICAAQEAVGGDLCQVYLRLRSMKLAVEDFLDSSGCLGVVLLSPAPVKAFLLFPLFSTMKFHPGVVFPEPRTKVAGISGVHFLTHFQ